MRDGASAVLKLFVVACEESGDRLGGALMQALRAATARPVQFAGVGGATMAQQGLQSLFPIDDMAIIGLNGILRRLPTLLRRIRGTTEAVLMQRPDALVIIDSPDFTHRVARRVRARAADIPIIDYVSPSVWAWRPSRARAMRRYIDHVLALLPFEPEAHARLGGPPCTYVGHPLVEAIALLRPSPSERLRRDRAPPIVLALPGSRPLELARHLPVFGAAVELLAKGSGPIDVVMPTLPHLAEQAKAAASAWPLQPRIVTGADEKWAAFRAARAALAASGTVTLELALAAIPTVAAYRVSLIEELVARTLIQVPSIVLANLILRDNVIPELLQRDATPERLAAALAPLLADTPERRRQLDAFARLDALMEIGGVSPSAKAASIVLDYATRGRAHLRREIGT